MSWGAFACVKVPNEGNSKWSIARFHLHHLSRRSNVLIACVLHESLLCNARSGCPAGQPSCGQVKMQGLELPCGQMTHSQSFSAHHHEHHSHHAYLRPPSLASHFSHGSLICVHFYQCSTKLFRPHPPSGGRVGVQLLHGDMHS